MVAPERQRAPRTAPGVRSEQLIRTAMPAFASADYADVKLKDVAAAAGVTRNLINHYFPGGKRELYLEAVRLACRELTELIDTDPDEPLVRKMPANIAAYLDEMLEPSPAYALYVRAQQSADEDVRTLSAATREAIASSIALNNLGTRTPPVPVLRALVGYIAFAESVCERYREQGDSDRPRLEQLLRDVLRSTVQAATAPADAAMATPGD